METSAVGCRLCLDPFADNFESIANLKEQMDKVFHFVIDLKPGYSATVCQSCSYTVCEFYKYSEKVRINQEWLNGVTSDPPEEDIKTVLILEDVKTEVPATDCIVEVVQGDSARAEADKNPIPKEESDVDPDDDVQYPSDDSYKPPAKPKAKPIKKARKRRRRSKTPSSEESDSFNSDDDEELRPRRKPRSTKTQEERDNESQRIMEFFTLTCDICSFLARDYKSYLEHFKTEHNRKAFIVCCKRKLVSKKSLINHIVFHNNPNAFRCDQCNKCYKDLEYLEMHKTNKHGTQSQDNPFKCDECDKSFLKKFMLNAHKEKHKTIQCQICNKVLSTSGSLNAHMANMHSEKNRTMVCDFCGQEFLNKVSFDRHLNEHNGIEIPKLQCPYCLKWYRGERNRSNHIEYVHNQREKGRQFPCDICHQNYPNERAMKKHKRYVHVEEKFECEFCGKRFKQSFNLKEHRTTHTGEVLYSCDYCGITKNSRANLYVHVKQKHPTEWAARKLRQAEENAS
ncbi:transcription factor grauzone isoform X1 [Aedes albopictus]|uniref:C2H2-type domain-containing protein n=1 Tax=Aedes albopictus TaxID=7160 RepID=A0ABM1Z732_AEDAL